MKVIATEAGFYGGQLRQPMEEFEFKGKKPGKWMAEVGKEDPKPEDDKEEDKGPTRKEIMTQLAAAGVQFKETMNKADLLVLLEETVKRLNPAGSGAPDKSENLL